MYRYIARRLWHSVIVLFVISILTFGLLHLGGDPVSLMAPDYFTEEDVDRMRERMGLDQPIYIQYGRYLQNVLQGDFGESWMQRRPALDLVIDRLPATIKLTLAAFVLTIVIGIPLGILSAVHRGSMIDRGALMFALSGQAVPNFWFGILLIILFSVILGWLPSFGDQGLKSLIMPSITLALAYTGVLTRVVRSSMIEVLDQDYIRTARAKGVHNQAVLYRHALRNASLPATTVLGLELGALLSGSVIVETVFAYPGVGWLAIQAIRAQDFPIILAFVAVMSVITLAITLAVDLLYAVLDPRVAYR